MWTSDLEAAGTLAREQESGRGDFPGPCPVVYDGEKTDGGAAANVAAAGRGASAVVLDAGEYFDGTGAADVGGAEIVWRVRSVEDVKRILKALGGGDDGDNVAFLAAGETPEVTSEILSSVPRRSLALAEVRAMQIDDAEIELSRSAYKPEGCASVVVRDACVGDGEDVAYSRHVLDGLTSKRSMEFNFSGLTGSTNGHFGGVAGNGKGLWKRTQHEEEENKDDV